MGLLDIFKNKYIKVSEKEVVDLSKYKFEFGIKSDPDTVFINNVISTEIMPKRKYGWAPNIVGSGKAPRNSRVIFTIAPEFAGTHRHSFEHMIIRRISTLNDRYPILSNDGSIGYITLDRVKQFTKSVHVELDDKNGKLEKKYTMYIHDNEDDYYMYFVFYDSDFDSKVIKSLLSNII